MRRVDGVVPVCRVEREAGWDTSVEVERKEGEEGVVGGRVIAVVPTGPRASLVRRCLSLLSSCAAVGDRCVQPQPLSLYYKRIYTHPSI